MNRANDFAPAQIVGPDGKLLQVQSRQLSMADAKLLREYKKFLLRHRLREAPVRCRDCFEVNREDFHHFFVTDSQIQYSCGCRQLFYQGQTLA